MVENGTRSFPVIDRILTFNRLPVGDEANYLNPSAHLLRLSKTEELFTITFTTKFEMWALFLRNRKQQQSGAHQQHKYHF